MRGHKGGEPPPGPEERGHAEGRPRVVVEVFEEVRAHDRVVAAPELRGLEVCVVGHSEIVGRPLALLLLEKFCTVTECHIATRDLKAHTRAAEVVVSAVGRPGLITAEMVAPGAIVIDVGINSVPVLDESGRPVLNEKGRPRRRVVGDVEFERVSEVASAITPVPGGVGPMTNAMLLSNLGAAARRQARQAR